MHTSQTAAATADAAKIATPLRWWATEELIALFCLFAACVEVETEAAAAS